MKPTFKRKSLVIGVLFLALVIAGGVALYATGNWQNPFAGVVTLFGGSSGFEGGRGGAGFPGGTVTNTDGFVASSTDSAATTAESGTSTTASSVSDTTSQRPSMGTRPSGGERGGEGGGAGLQWAQIGSVLYDLWFLAAASAVIMLITAPLTWIRRARRQARAAA